MLTNHLLFTAGVDGSNLIVSAQVRDGLSWAVGITEIVVGVATVVLLFVALFELNRELAKAREERVKAGEERKEAEEERKEAVREKASRVTVWVAEAFEIPAPGSPDTGYALSEGIVLTNATDLVARDVDVVLGTRTRGADASSPTQYALAEPVPGLRLSVVPPGSYFVPLVKKNDTGAGEQPEQREWRQSIPLRSNDGRLVVSLPNDGAGSSSNGQRSALRECEVRPFTPKTVEGLSSASTPGTEMGRLWVFATRFKLGALRWILNYSGEVKRVEQPSNWDNFAELSSLEGTSRPSKTKDEYEKEFTDSEVQVRTQITGADLPKRLPRHKDVEKLVQDLVTHWQVTRWEEIATDDIEKVRPTQGGNGIVVYTNPGHPLVRLYLPGKKINSLGDQNTTGQKVIDPGGDYPSSAAHKVLLTADGKEKQVKLSKIPTRHASYWLENESELLEFIRAELDAPIKS